MLQKASPRGQFPLDRDGPIEVRLKSALSSVLGLEECVRAA